MLSLPPLARLVLVVDEFRALADDVPEFVDGLVRFAAVGRSLGIHLVLATQRPAGVITADMRANLGLRIALRVRDRADSMDVIESAAAAELPLTLPGRALMRSGSESLTALQTAMVTAPAAEPQMSIEVTWSDGTVLRRQFPTTEDQASAPPAAQARTSVPDTDLVSAIATAARAGNHQCAPTPWLPALPPELTWTPEVPATGWALIDLPAEQRQSIEVAEIETLRPTAICGAPGSGRTTSALTLAVASVRSDPERVHVYALGDPGSPLCALTTLPQCGALVDRSDPAAVADLVARLTSELTTRRSEPSPTRLLLVIDGFEVLADACDALDHATVTDRLLSLIRDGHPLGLRAIVTGDHTAATGRVARVCPDRFLHRPADRNQLSLLGVHADAAPRDWPSGRLVRVHDSAQLQVLTRPVEVPRGPARQPWRLQPLPTRLTTAELQRAAILSASSSALASALALGVSSTPGDVVAVGAEQRRRLLLLGSPGSGRTSALTTLAAAAKDGGRQVCIVAEAHTPLAAAARALELPALDWADPEPLIERRREHPDLVVLADDVDRHLESALVPVLEQIADLVERDAGLIAVSGDAAALALRPRGIAASVARGRLAVVLGQPSAPDADLVGVRLPRTRDALPGRGWLIAGRTVTPVQLAVRDTGP